MWRKYIQERQILVELVKSSWLATIHENVENESAANIRSSHVDHAGPSTPVERTSLRIQMRVVAP